MMKEKLIHIYTGDGKGKTTSAVGCAVRAAGAGLKVMFVQLFKDGTSSELKILKQLDGVCVKVLPLNHFTWEMTQSEVKEYAKSAIALISENICLGYDLLIIDEFFALMTADGLTESTLSDIILRRDCELILTGRNAPKSFLKLADYVSDIQCVKHPFERGVPARKGIEF